MRGDQRSRLWVVGLFCLGGLSCEEQRAPIADLTFDRDSGARSGRGDGDGGEIDGGEIDGGGGIDGGEGPGTDIGPGQDGRFDPTRVYLVADVDSSEGRRRVIVDASDVVNMRAVGDWPAWITEKGELLHDYTPSNAEPKVTQFVCDAPCGAQFSAAHTLSADPAKNDVELGTLTCGALIVAPHSELFETCGDFLRGESDEVLASEGVSWIAVGPGRIAIVKRLATEYAEKPIALMDLKSGAFTEITGADIPQDLTPQRVRRLDDGFWALGGPVVLGGEATRYRIALDGVATMEGTYFPLAVGTTTFEKGVGILGADGSMYRVVPYLTDSQGGTHMAHAVLRTELNKNPTPSSVLLDTDFAATKLLPPMVLVTGS